MVPENPRLECRHHCAAHGGAEMQKTQAISAPSVALASRESDQWTQRTRRPRRLRDATMTVDHPRRMKDGGRQNEGAKQET
jgi:hypothetical protein